MPLKEVFLREEIEVHLNLFLQLKDGLSIHLPFPEARYTEGSYYTASTEEIDAARIEASQLEADPAEFTAYLCSNPFWQNRMLQEHPELQDAFKAAKEEKYNQLSEMIEWDSIKLMEDEKVRFTRFFTPYV